MSVGSRGDIVCMNLSWSYFIYNIYIYGVLRISVYKYNDYIGRKSYGLLCTWDREVTNGNIQNQYKMLPRMYCACIV